MIEIRIEGDNASLALRDLKQLAEALLAMEDPKVVEVKPEVKESEKEEPQEEKPAKEDKKSQDKSKNTTETNKSNGKGTTGNATGKDKEAKPDITGDTEDSGEKETYTLVEVRAKAMEIQRSGKKDFLKQVLEACGASKLSEIPEDKYTYAMKCFETGKVLDDEELPF